MPIIKKPHDNMQSPFCDWLHKMQEVANVDNIIVEARHYDVLDFYFKEGKAPDQAYKEYKNFRRRWYAINGLPLSDLVRVESVRKVMQDMQIAPTPTTLEKIKRGEFIRADGDCVCTGCGAPYKLHPAIEGYEWLNYICTGLIVKL